MIKRAYYWVLRKLSSWKYHFTSNDHYVLIVALPSDFPCLAYMTLQYLNKCKLKDCFIINLIPDSSSCDYIGLIQGIFKKPYVVFYPDKKLSFLCSFNPFKRHWLQIYTGIKNARSKYAILKGSNLLIRDFGFYDKYYRHMKKSRCFIGGIKPRNHINSWIMGTYEMIINIKELTSQFNPVDMLPKTIDGVQYDNMLWIEKQLGKNKIFHEEKPDLLHVSFLMGTIRNMLKNNIYDDMNFKMWFVCWLNEGLKGTEWHSGKILSLKNYHSKYRLFIDKNRIAEIFVQIRNLNWLLGWLELNNKDLLKKELRWLDEEINKICEP